MSSKMVTGRTSLAIAKGGHKNMTNAQAFKAAHTQYRESPNTFGHEENDVPRQELKRIIGLVASQEQLQRSIQINSEMGMGGNSKGTLFIWERLKEVEDQLRTLEEKHGKEFNSKEYLTDRGRQGVSPVPVSVSGF